MRIKVMEIAPEVRVKVTGDEPWLERMYADFPAPAGARPRLQGDLKLRAEEGGSVAVTGRLDFAPLVSCSRCAREIDWPVSIDVDARFLPEAYNEQPKEKNLSRAELDAYYLEDKSVDLEMLVNDLVQTALPTSMVPATEDGQSCRVCKVDLTNEHVFALGEAPVEDKAPSPFAALKGLKLKN